MMIIMANGNMTVAAVTLVMCIGFMLDLGGYITYTLINPTVFLVGEAILTAAIVLANTPLLKGAAVAAFSVWLFAFFLTMDIPVFGSPWKELVYAVLFVPPFIGVGMEMLEVGKG
jgi:hypothetical protein